MTAAITDFTQFAELRRQADNRDPEALRAVAGQFEALFLETMLKSMREASIGDSLFGDNEAHDMYQDLLDRQFAMEMASGRGIGLADLLVRQMSGREAARIPDAPAVSAIEPRRQPGWRDAQSFARDVWPHATRVADKLGVAPEAVLAQAALETGWGQHVMTTSDGGSSNNLFGIKASGGWQGDSVLRTTLEFDDGIANRQAARFRAYGDVGETFDDYAELLDRNPRYAAVRGHGDDIRGFATALADAGYATDPEYAQKIERVAGSDTMQRVLDGLKKPPGAPIVD